MNETLEVAGCRLVAEITPGAGGPIVFLHGASSSREDARRILALADTGRPLLMPDSRGHGGSAEGEVDRQSWQQLTDDAVAWLDHVDARDAVVAGVSMGAIIAPAVALARPDRVSSLVPIYPVYLGNDVPPEPDHEKALAFLLASFSVPDVDAILAAVAAVAPDRDIEPVRARLALHDNLDGMCSYFRDDRSAQSLSYSTADLRGIRLPVTVVGGADPFHPAEVARRLAPLFASSTLVELVDVAPEDHEAAMAKAIAEHVARLS
ncbi:MAG: alpha/beta hydrolase [Frankiales bacterium]|nr:alpha/beta hydrolase [Frankiales bacterium]